MRASMVMPEPCGLRDPKNQMPRARVQQRLARAEDQGPRAMAMQDSCTKNKVHCRKPRARDQGPRAKEEEPRTKSQRPRLCHAWTHRRVSYIYIYIYVCRSGIPIFQISDFPISRSPEFQLSRFADFVGQTLRSQPDPIPNPCTHACRDHILRKEPSLAYAL